MAAEVLVQGGARVTVYDAMPSPGRKFLLAGRGGLNLTHSEDLQRLLTRYGAAEHRLRPPIEAFPPSALRAWDCFGLCAANASLSLRTTGASIVEDADRTNSPISWSLAITALLSTPNSFASSYTRTFATALPLLGPDHRTIGPTRARSSGRRQILLFIAAFSSGAHHNRILLSRR